ncbi:uncharacterized protein ARMOST_20709 [Armillaria ostoyae]|uniref:Uncharacterized protein n=1 Tax=Armillaria ostoyae TaxID=47428 RepID=A0A284S829_ARMOS|nr:uncharacterized protein ARMOST_20709 [Armillaria ostoyae]
MSSYQLRLLLRTRSPLPRPYPDVYGGNRVLTTIIDVYISTETTQLAGGHKLAHLHVTDFVAGFCTQLIAVPGIATSNYPCGLVDAIGWATILKTVLWYQVNEQAPLCLEASTLAEA